MFIPALYLTLLFCYTLAGTFWIRSYRKNIFFLIFKSMQLPHFQPLSVFYVYLSLGYMGGSIMWNLPPSQYAHVIAGLTSTVVIHLKLFFLHHRWPYNLLSLYPALLARQIPGWLRLLMNCRIIIINTWQWKRRSNKGFLGRPSDY